MKTNKELLKESLPSLSFSFVLLIIVLVLRPNFYLLCLLLVLYVVGKALYYKKTLGAFLNELITLLVIVLIIRALYYWLGSSLLSFIVVVLFLAGVILWRTRKQYLGVIRDIERKHFGETREERRKRLKGK